MISRSRQNNGHNIAMDGVIKSLWDAGYCTVEIAIKMHLPLAFVANRLAAIRDAGYQP